jgi:polysaccharide export outer membrane protein
MMKSSLLSTRLVAIGLACAAGGALSVRAQTPAVTPGTAPAASAAAASVPLPADYVIGPEDVLGVVFWRDQDMTGDVTVRPDGMVTLPLLGDLHAAGLTPDALRDQVQKAASKYVQDPNVTIVVRTINSRKVFITGEVTTPGAYPLTSPRTVMQLIALAGGLTEYADSKNITVMRTEQGTQRSFKFNYKDVAGGKKLEQNIQLKPGDTVVVP